MSSVPCYCPEGIGPLSPEHCSRTVAHVRHAGAGTGRCRVVYGVYPRSNGMVLAGHQGHYYHGVPPPSYYYCSVTVPLLFRHCSITVPSLFRH